MSSIIFFTLRDFHEIGGGSIRINGLISSAINSGHNTRVFSLGKIRDAEDIDIGISFSKFEKRIFQLLLTFTPFFLMKVIFYRLYKSLKEVSYKYDLKNSNVIFCEYLDLSVGYFMYRAGMIGRYTCDIHGMVPNEFLIKDKNKIFKNLRANVAKKLDDKVFNLSSSFIFASESMERYFYREYNLKDKETLIIPYFIQRSMVKSVVIPSLKNKIIADYQLTEFDNKIFFAGQFKEFGGVTYLIRAFKKVLSLHPNSILILIGKGPTLKECISYLDENKISYVHIPQIPYEQLRTYQEVSDVLVCPDVMNLYSNFILHLKYIDSLCSNKIVINGSFDSVLEVNNHECLSINYTPSNAESLAGKICYAIENKEELLSKYRNNRSFVKDKFTYECKNIDFSIL